MVLIHLAIDAACLLPCLHTCWGDKSALVQLGAILAYGQANISLAIRLQPASLSKLLRCILVVEWDLEGRLVGEALIEWLACSGLLMGVDCVFLVSACCEHDCCGCRACAVDGIVNVL